MATKRPLEDDAVAPRPRKHRAGFKIGPENLPDVVKIKKDLIHKAKVKKSYAKLKAREPGAQTPSKIVSEAAVPAAEPSQVLHPERLAMLDTPRAPTPPPQSLSGRPRLQRKGKRPAYFEKEEAYAQHRRAEAEASRLEFERRDKERKEKIEERERLRRAMAKARSGGKNGQRKLGKESEVLLERVKKMVRE